MSPPAAAPAFPPPRTLSWEVRRLFRFIDSAQRGVLSVGGLAALYFGVELLAGVYRGERWLVTDSFLGGVAAAGAYTGARGVGWVVCCRGCGAACGTASTALCPSLTEQSP